MQIYARYKRNQRVFGPENIKVKALLMCVVYVDPFCVNANSLSSHRRVSRHIDYSSGHLVADAKNSSRFTRNDC